MPKPGVHLEGTSQSPRSCPRRCLHLKTAVGSEKDNVGRLHWIVVGKQNPAMIQSSLKVGSSRAANGKVPLKEIVLQEEKERKKKVRTTYTRVAKELKEDLHIAYL